MRVTHRAQLGGDSGLEGRLCHICGIGGVAHEDQAHDGRYYYTGHPIKWKFVNSEIGRSYVR
jgi:hypothetical protein